MQSNLYQFVFNRNYIDGYLSITDGILKCDQNKLDLQAL